LTCIACVLVLGFLDEPERRLSASAFARLKETGIELWRCSNQKRACLSPHSPFRRSVSVEWMIFGLRLRMNGELQPDLWWVAPNGTKEYLRYFSACELVRGVVPRPQKPLHSLGRTAN
jgi:hypothetical protein